MSLRTQGFLSVFGHPWHDSAAPSGMAPGRCKLYCPMVGNPELGKAPCLQSVSETSPGAHPTPARLRLIEQNRVTWTGLHQSLAQGMRPSQTNQDPLLQGVRRGSCCLGACGGRRPGADRSSCYSCGTQSHSLQPSKAKLEHAGHRQ